MSNTTNRSQEDDQKDIDDGCDFKRLSRQSGHKLTKSEIKQIFEGESQPVEDRSTTFTFFQLVFTAFLPFAVRKQIPLWVQIAMGILVFIILVTFFVFLFFYYGDCPIEVEETSQIRSDAICRAHLITQQTQLGLDVNNKWSNERGYDVVTGGPWQIDFRAYEANQSAFEDNINYLRENVRDLMDEFQNQTFIKNLQTAFFYESVVNGTFGNAVLTSNIDITTIFQNYIPSGLQVGNFKQELNSTERELGTPKLPEEEMQFEWRSSCILGDDISSYWNCTQFYDNDVRSYNEIWYLNDPSSTIKNSFGLFEIAQYRYYYNMTQQDEKVIDFTKRFSFDWSFTEAFVFDYCNSQGKKFCQSLLDFENQNFKDDEYTLIPGFWSSLTSRRPIPSENFNKKIALRAVYIDAFESFGLLIGSNTIGRISGSYPYSGQIDFVAVPEIINLADLSDRRFEFEEPVVRSVGTKHVCQSCQELREFLSYPESTHTGYLDYDCQATIGVFLHLYGFDKFEDVDGEVQDAATIDFDYVSTVAYYFDQQDVMYQRRLLDGIFLYNTQFSQVSNLRCNGSEWYIDNLNFSTPFELNSGIYTCQFEACTSVLERLANSQANTELAYLAIVLIIIAVFVCIALPGMRSKNKEQREKKKQK